ncbi:hypothetical protein PIIN_09456 [Serendipita indica DSM 11827]|uniref:Uncharacterized protein n=1 Tax=Serendipita indica (strain DSM 11827) TaxID=1109443 RepID=G4TVY0_SERID|nr:hypothetical protein PIIN_09456 [Serendipita indica DSM 11827]
MSLAASHSQAEQGQSPSTEGPPLIDKETLSTKAINAKLPTAIKSDVDSWIALAQTVAVTSALFAGVQISLNQIIESAMSGGGDSPQGYPLPVWHGLRWFMYGAVIVNLGCAGSAVAVINMAASLECDIGYMATKYYRRRIAGEAAERSRQENSEHKKKSKRETEKAKRYEAVYTWVATEKLTDEFFDHKADIRRLQRFGIGKSFGFITWSMTLTFIVGGVFIFLTFLYWVALTQVKAAIALIAVAVALGLSLTLSFLLY